MYKNRKGCRKKAVLKEMVMVKKVRGDSRFGKWCFGEAGQSQCENWVELSDSCH